MHDDHDDHDDGQHSSSSATATATETAPAPGETPSGAPVALDGKALAKLAKQVFRERRKAIYAQRPAVDFEGWRIESRDGATHLVVVYTQDGEACSTSIEL